MAQQCPTEAPSGAIPRLRHPLAAALATALLISACAAAASSPSPRRPLTVLVIGDSLAEGVTTTLTRSRPDLEITGGGINGSGLASYTVDWIAEADYHLQAHHPDAVIVSIGTNDARTAARDPAGYAARTEALMDRLEGVPTVWFLPPDSALPRLPGLNTVHRIQHEAASRHGGITLMRWPEGFAMWDGIHQTWGGYALAGELALDTLGRNGTARTVRLP